MITRYLKKISTKSSFRVNICSSILYAEIQKRIKIPQSFVIFFCRKEAPLDMCNEFLEKSGKSLHLEIKLARIKALNFW